MDYIESGLTRKDLESLKAANIGDTVTLDCGRAVRIADAGEPDCPTCAFRGNHVLCTNACVSVGENAGWCSDTKRCFLLVTP